MGKVLFLLLFKNWGKPREVKSSLKSTQLINDGASILTWANSPDNIGQEMVEVVHTNSIRNIKGSCWDF